MTEDKVPPLRELEDVYPELYKKLETGDEKERLTSAQLHDELIADGYFRWPQNVSPRYLDAKNWFGSGKPSPYS